MPKKGLYAKKSASPPKVQFVLLNMEKTTRRKYQPRVWSVGTFLFQENQTILKTMFTVNFMFEVYLICLP